jgi:hypothetical protein
MGAGETSGSRTSTGSGSEEPHAAASMMVGAAMNRAIWIAMVSSHDPCVSRAMPEPTPFGSVRFPWSAWDSSQRTKNALWP